MSRTPIAAICVATLVAVAAVVLSSAGAQEGGVEAENADAADSQVAAASVKHVVLFKFKESATPEVIAQIEAGFAALPEKIDGIIDFDWGTNNSPENLNEGFTHCFIVTFKDAAARDAYLPHPAHQEFVKLLRPHLEQPLVVDFSPQ